MMKHSLCFEGLCLSAILSYIILFLLGNASNYKNGNGVQKALMHENNARRLEVELNGKSRILQQIHISLSGLDGQNGESNAISVMWMSQEPYGCNESTLGNQTRPKVLYSLDETSIKHYNSNNDSLKVYRANGSCISYVKDGGFHHQVILPNLQYGVRYYYRVINQHEVSEVHSFVMPKNAEDGQTNSIADDFHVEFSDKIAANLASGSHRILFNADLDVFREEGIKTVGRIRELANFAALDMIFLAGDISYADSAYDYRMEYEEAWNGFMNAMEPAASKVSLMVSVGNHEADCSDPTCQSDPVELRQLANYAAYRNRFAMNGDKQEGGYGNMWYSFNIGKIHFAVICSECNYPGHPSNKEANVDILYGNFPGDQLQWLNKDLSQANEERDIRPWVIVVGHRPIYSARNADIEGNPTNDDDGIPNSGVAKSMQAAFEDMLYIHDVDLYLSGHNHGYERTVPVYQGEVLTGSKKQGTIHITSSSGGNHQGLRSFIREQYDLKWLAHIDYSTLALSLLTIRHDGSLLWTQHRRSDMVILDQLELTLKDG